MKGKAMTTNKIIAALLLGFSVAVLAFPATARITREAAINKCLAEAKKAFPTVDQDIQFGQLYRACMQKLGHNP